MPETPGFSEEINPIGNLDLKSAPVMPVNPEQTEDIICSIETVHAPSLGDMQLYAARKGKNIGIGYSEAQAKLQLRNGGTGYDDTLGGLTISYERAILLKKEFDRMEMKRKMYPDKYVSDGRFREGFEGNKDKVKSFELKKLGAIASLRKKITDKVSWGKEKNN